MGSPFAPKSNDLPFALHAGRVLHLTDGQMQEGFVAGIPGVAALVAAGGLRGGGGSAGWGGGVLVVVIVVVGW